MLSKLGRFCIEKEIQSKSPFQENLILYLYYLSGTRGTFAVILDRLKNTYGLFLQCGSCKVDGEQNNHQPDCSKQPPIRLFQTTTNQIIP